MVLWLLTKRFGISPWLLEQESKAHISLETGFALPNMNEINTKNMKCTWPTQAPTQGDPTRPIFHWLALGAPGFAVAAPVSRWVHRGLRWVRRGFGYQHVYVSPVRNGRVGDQTQCDGPTRVFSHLSGI